MAKRGTVIVTGGSQGIGTAVVQAFLGRGYSVVATSRKITQVGLTTSPNFALVDGRSASCGRRSARRQMVDVMRVPIPEERMWR
jgi:NAD(P)-dependent dehydrogenase (short-subunit alcohol dehydrogenase family)